MQMKNVIEPGTINTGIVYVKDNCIFYYPKSAQSLRIAITDIAIIGEYTLNDHPLTKNYWYMVFVRSNGSWQSIPWFTENMQQLKEYLAFHFKTAFPIDDLSITLRGKSLIRYPDDLKGHALFRFTPPYGYKTPLTTWQKIMSFLRLGTYSDNWQLELTDEVIAFLQ
jgi:hypothetical protein